MRATETPAAHVPVSLFGIVLGLAGLGHSWRTAARVWRLPALVGEALLAVAALVWLGLLWGYAIKWLRSPQAARDELAHTVQSGFVALVPLSTMLMALAIAPYSHTTATAVWLAAVAGQLVFGVSNTARLWQGGREPETVTTVLYLPTVGVNFVAALVAGQLGYSHWGLLLFGTGLLAWLCLESVVLQRHALLAPLACGLRPTLGIQLAPPVVGLLAWLSLTQGPVDALAHFLFGYGLFQGLVLMRCIPWFRGGGFTPGLWAFSFGSTATATAALWMTERGNSGPARNLAVPLFAGANIFVVILTILTARLALRGQLFGDAPAALSRADSAASPAAARLERSARAK